MAWGDREENVHCYSYSKYKSENITKNIIITEINEKYDFFTFRHNNKNFKCIRNSSYKNLSTYGLFQIEQSSIFETRRCATKEEYEIFLEHFLINHKESKFVKDFNYVKETYYD